MLNKQLGQDPAALYRAATDRAIEVIEAMQPEQLASRTPCSEWNVQRLIDHLAGGAST